MGLLMMVFFVFFVLLYPKGCKNQAKKYIKLIIKKKRTFSKPCLRRESKVTLWVWGRANGNAKDTNMQY